MDKILDHYNYLMLGLQMYGKNIGSLNNEL